MRKLLNIFGFLIVSSLITAAASAATITFDLNCTFNAPGACDPSVSFGTLSLSDTATDGEFSLTVDLVGNQVHRVQSIYLNFGPGLAGYSFSDANGEGVEQDEDNVKADGFSAGFFDLAIPDAQPGNLGFEPYSNTIIVTGLGLESLSVEAFNDVISGNGLLFAAVHIGNIGDIDGGPYIPGEPGEGSVFVGAPNRTSTTPEPGLLVLLGTGLLGVAAATRRRREEG